jgi:ATP-dependent exoDNAse (exonuclease V) alpha subunit
MKKSQLSEHQQEVFQQITDKIKENLLSKIVNIPLFARFLSLTGAAGTGKSYLTAAIVDEIDNFLPVGQYDIYVTAPTHKAVTVMKEMLFYSYDIGVKCCTIHSFLSLKQSYNYETGAEKFTIDRSKDKINRASLLIVDESSMVSNELFEFIAEVVKKGYVNTVLFIGDSYQLLPVNQSSLNDVFRLRNQFKLTQIVRQAKDSQIIQLSTEIRTKISTNDYVDLREIFDEIDKNSEDIQFFTNKREFIKDFYKNENWQDEDKILTSFTNNEVDNFNNAIRRRFWREQGNDAPKFLLPNDKIRFKKPSFDINSDNQKILFQNGEEVTIEKAELIFDEKLRFYYWDCLATGRPLSSFRVVDPYSMEKFNDILNDYAYFARTSNYPENLNWWDKYFKLRDSFSDVQYTFASTIHKLQGSSYKTVYFDLSSLLNNRNLSKNFIFRLVYVAITRAKKCVKILL